MTPDLGADSSERLETAVDLVRVGQELTAFNFIVADGIVDYGSISHVNVPLRASGDK